MNLDETRSGKGYSVGVYSVRFFRHDFENSHGVSLCLSDRMQINLRGAPVLMPEDSLNRSDVNIAATQNGGSLMPQGMKTKIADTRFSA
jgi:hypothetical protein